MQLGPLWEGCELSVNQFATEQKKLRQRRRTRAPCTNANFATRAVFCSFQGCELERINPRQPHGATQGHRAAIIAAMVLDNDKLYKLIANLWRNQCAYTVLPTKRTCCTL